MYSRKLSNYVIPEYGIKFIDRETEFSKLISWLFKSEIPWNFVIYGPWGCGKSEFARVFTWVFEEQENVHVFYIDLAREKSGIILYSKQNLRNEILKLIKSIFGKLTDIVLNLYSLVKSLSHYFKVENSQIIIFVDEVKKVIDVYGESIEYLITNAESTIRECKRELNLKSMSIIFITSEQTLINQFLKYEGKSITTLLMWHLPEKDFQLLLKSLGIEDGETIESFVRFFSTCPRIAIDFVRMYSKDLELLIMDYIDKFTTSIIK